MSSQPHQRVAKFVTAPGDSRSLCGKPADRRFRDRMDAEQMRHFVDPLLEVQAAGTEATARHRRERAAGIVKLWTSSPLPTA